MASQRKEKSVKDRWEIPKIHSTFVFYPDYRDRENDPKTFANELWSISFCPYLKPEWPPIFATCNDRYTLICRISDSSDSHALEFLRIIRADDDDAGNCALTWALSRDKEPLLCLAGSDRKIKVIRAIDGRLFDTLVGHGEDINDLKTSPADSEIIASASKDTTIRIWSLKPQHKLQPCVYILGGLAHQFDVLTIAFHESGRYLLSSGHDQIINLWTLTGKPPDESTASTKPKEIYYPHFSTSEVHSALVDCIEFLGDLIISRACYEEKIVIWSIVGFDSRISVKEEDAPSNFDQSVPTRSAFSQVDEESPQLFSRLLELKTPGVGEAKLTGNMFFMRFGLYTGYRDNPILAFGNAGSKILFWDLARLMDIQHYLAGVNDGENPPVPKWLPLGKNVEPKQSLGRKQNITQRSSAIRIGKEEASQSVQGIKALVEKGGKYFMGEPSAPLGPHSACLLTMAKGKPKFVARQAAWSSCGRWCVVVGSNNRIVILRRWDSEKI